MLSLYSELQNGHSLFLLGTSLHIDNFISYYLGQFASSLKSNSLYTFSLNLRVNWPIHLSIVQCDPQSFNLDQLIIHLFIISLKLSLLLLKRKQQIVRKGTSLHIDNSLLAEGTLSLVNFPVKVQHLNVRTALHISHNSKK